MGDVPNRKKTLCRIIHIPHSVKDRIDELREKLKLECFSDAIIVAVDAYYESLKSEEPKDGTM